MSEKLKELIPIALPLGELAVSIEADPEINQQIENIEQLIDPNGTLPTIKLQPYPNAGRYPTKYYVYADTGDEQGKIGYLETEYDPNKGWNCFGDVGLDGLSSSPVWKKGYGTRIYLSVIQASLREGVDFGSSTNVDECSGLNENSEKMWKKLTKLGIAERVEHQNRDGGITDTSYVIRANSLAM